jgi:DNA-binding transcriptional regulator YdaS (Cro superfamily)
MDKSAIERACDAVGGQVKLAELVKVTPQAVNQWVAKQRVPLDRVKTVVLAAGGKVSAHELAPDLYPDGFEFPAEAAA